MTLIVGKRFNNNLWIESDTKITNCLGKKSNPLTEKLKVVMLHLKVCLAFSGNVYYAEKAIKELIEYSKPAPIKKTLEIEKMLKVLIEKRQESVQNSNSHVDFVLCAILEEDIKIYKIHENKYETIDNFWLGDQNAFDKFQNYYHTRYKHRNDTERLALAFKDVVEDGEIKTVGNFQISLTTFEDIDFGLIFLYMPKFELSISQQNIEKLPHDKDSVLSLGKIADLSYGFSFLSSLSQEKFGIAIHFTHSNFGILFCPQISQQGILIKEADGQAFVNEIKDKFNITLLGTIRISETEFKDIPGEKNRQRIGIRRNSN